MLKRLLFLLLIIVFLLATVAVATPVRFIANHVMDVSLAGIAGLDGNLLKGSAQINFAKLKTPAGGKIASFMPSMSLAWNWCPSNGMLAYCVSTTSYQPQIEVKSIIQASLSTVSFKDTYIQGQSIKYAIRPGYEVLSDNVNLRLDDMRFDYDEAFPTTINGMLVLQQFNASINGVQFPIGNLRGAIRSEKEQQIDIRVQGKGEKISRLNGTIALTEQSYSYELDIDSDDVIVQGVLLVAGKKSSKGYRLKGNKKW